MIQSVQRGPLQIAEVSEFQTPCHAGASSSEARVHDRRKLLGTNTYPTEPDAHLPMQGALARALSALSRSPDQVQLRSTTST